MCSHNDIDINGTCIDCGECDLKSRNWTELIPVRKYQECGIDRKLFHFRSIMNLRSGKQSLGLSHRKFTLIKDVVSFLYNESYTEKSIRDVLKKLKMKKYIIHTYLIYCLLKNIKCLSFDIYEPYFEYLYTKLLNEYSKLYPYKYFINSSFVLSCFLNEVGITDGGSYYFKNINTFETQNKIYLKLRSMVLMNYPTFIKAI